MGTEVSGTLGSLDLADGRQLEWSSVGPPNATILLDHHGTPGSRVPAGVMARAATARGLRLVTTSRPGYGRSSRAPGRTVVDVVGDSAALLDELGADAAYVIGASGGGPHALACGALLGERVLGVAVLAGVAPLAAEGLDWLAGMGEDNVEEFTLALAGEGTLRPFLDAARPELLKADAEGVLAVLGGLLPEVDRACLTGEVAADAAASMAEAVVVGVDGWLDDDLAFTQPWGFELTDLGRLTGRGKPVSIWQGDADLMVPFAHGQWLAEHVPGARAHLLPGEGHLSIGIGSIDAILEELTT